MKDSVSNVDYGFTVGHEYHPLIGCTFRYRTDQLKEGEDNNNS